MADEQPTVNGTSNNKSLILNAFVETCRSMNLRVASADRTIIDPELGSGHQSPGLWRHPDDQSARFNDVDHWTELAQLLEKGKFHGMFIADVLGP